MSGTVTVNCKHCRDPFTARVADRKRGWARFCSKSCKAKHQEKRTGQHAAYRDRQRIRIPGEVEGHGWGEHKDWLT
jgi:DNA replicative helicase MCM subunit Mcm2 (Cdc46/Mcm family)